MKEIVAKLYSLSGNKMPMILQTELAECGIASIAMIANYYGHETDLASLRRKFSTSLHGSNFQDLINIAAKLNLSARAVKLEPEGMKNLKLPCILHWPMNHFVVLRKIHRNIAVIMIQRLE